VRVRVPPPAPCFLNLHVDFEAEAVVSLRRKVSLPHSPASFSSWPAWGQERNVTGGRHESGQGIRMDPPLGRRTNGELSIQPSRATLSSAAII
jgi:hypothetical protein